MTDGQAEIARRQSLHRIKQTVAARLAYVCQHFDAREFDELVTQIAEIEIKYSSRKSGFFGAPATQSSSQRRV
jgi:hypothetical protein